MEGLDAKRLVARAHSLEVCEIMINTSYDYHDCIVIIVYLIINEIDCTQDTIEKRTTNIKTKGKKNEEKNSSTAINIPFIQPRVGVPQSLQRC